MHRLRPLLVRASFVLSVGSWLGGCADDDDTKGSGGASASGGTSSGGGGTSAGGSAGSSGGSGGTAGATGGTGGSAGGVGGGSTGGTGGATGGAGGATGGAAGSGGASDASVEACVPVTVPVGQVVDCSGATIAKTVDISGFAFSPSSVSLKVGEVVKFDNKDFSTHTATSGTPSCVDGSWDTGNIGASGAKCVKLGAAGTFPYFCAIHPSMTGTLVVGN